MSYPNLPPVTLPESGSPLPYHVLTTMYPVFAGVATRYLQTIEAVGWKATQAKVVLDSIFNDEVPATAAKHSHVLWEAVVIQTSNEDLVVRMTAKPVNGDQMGGSAASIYDIMKTNHTGDYNVRVWCIEFHKDPTTTEGVDA